MSARADRTVADRQLVGAVHGARSATRTAAPRSTARTATIPAQRGAPSIERGRATGRAYARREDRLRKLVGSRAPRTAPTAGRAKFVLLVMALLVAGLILTLWLSTAAAADSYRLQDARVAARGLSEQSEQLRREVMAMDAAPALAQQAAELGMVPVQDSARLVVGPDGTVTLAGTPKAAIATAPPAPPPVVAPNGAAPSASPTAAPTATPNGADPNTPTADAAAAAGGSGPSAPPQRPPRRPHPTARPPTGPARTATPRAGSPDRGPGHLGRGGEPYPGRGRQRRADRQPARPPTASARTTPPRPLTAHDPRRHAAGPPASGRTTAPTVRDRP